MSRGKLPEAGQNFACLRKWEKDSILGLQWGGQGRIWGRREVDRGLAMLRSLI